jgi:hypothetical protein
VYEIPAAGGYTTVNTLGGGFSNPTGVAMDGSGDVFVADFGNNAVKEIPSSCIAGANNASCILPLLSGNFSAPAGVAVDGSGNVYVADGAQESEILAEYGYVSVQTLGTGFDALTGVAVDRNGNVYVADPGNSAVKEIELGSVNFGSEPVGATGSVQT